MGSGKRLAFPLGQSRRHAWAWGIATSPLGVFRPDRSASMGRQKSERFGFGEVGGLIAAKLRISDELKFAGGATL